jgi:hypothetical protein
MSANINTYLKREVARLTEENRLLKEENLSLRQYIDSLNALMEALDDLSPDAEIMPLLDRILYNGLMVVNATEGSLLALDDETGELEFVLAQGTVGREKLVGQRLPPGKGIAGWVAKNNKPTIVNSAQADYRFYSAIDDQNPLPDQLSLGGAYRGRRARSGRAGDGQQARREAVHRNRSDTAYHPVPLRRRSPELQGQAGRRTGRFILTVYGNHRPFPADRAVALRRIRPARQAGALRAGRDVATACLFITSHKRCYNGHFTIWLGHRL